MGGGEEEDRTTRESGGYGDILQTLSGDDDLMVQNAIRNNARIGAMLGAGTYTFTDPPESLREHFNRKRRHVSTSLHYSFKNQIILSLWYLSSMVVNTSLLFWVHPFIFLLPLFRYMLEIVLYKRLEKSLHIDKTIGFKLSPLAIILNSLLFDLFTVYTFVSQFFVKTKWKGN